MKRMKMLALMVAALLLLSACNAVNVTEVAMVGDNVMEKPEFMYYLQSGKSQAMQEAQLKGLTIETNADWNKVMLGDKTAAEFAKEKALEGAKTILVLEAKAKAEGYVLTEEDKAEITAQKDQIIEQLGGRYGYEQALDEMGITVDSLDAIVERSVYANAYMKQFTEADTSLEPTEEEIQAAYKGDYVFVRHILISNQPPEETVEDVDILEEDFTETAEEPVDYDAQAKEKAEGILAELKNGGDFIALMNEHSEDGRGEDGKLLSDGYVMTDNGQMVPAFEEAAMKLEEGAFTQELVATDYGYHILMRYALPTSGTQYDSAISEVEADLTSKKLADKVEVWADEMGFALNQRFFDKLKIKMEG